MKFRGKWVCCIGMMVMCALAAGCMAQPTQDHAKAGNAADAGGEKTGKAADMEGEEAGKAADVEGEETVNAADVEGEEAGNAAGEGEEKAGSTADAGETKSAVEDRDKTAKKMAGKADAVPRELGTVEILVASDLHYLSSGLTDYHESFLELLARGDGKVEQYSPEITDAFLDEVRAERPDVLILSGDLTFNGEKDNHRELAGKLRRLQEDGIPVLVIPGNHDLESRMARRFAKGRSYVVDSVTREEFLDIYGDLGYDKAISRDPDSLSFVYPLTEGLWVLMLDANTVETPGFVHNQTCRWLEEQLLAAEASGARVISVTHQNLLVHNAMFADGFAIENYERIWKLYKRYGVRLNLSGHMHIQHIASQDGIYDIATGSLLVAPVHYGRLLIQPDGRCTYEARETDVAAWARAAGSRDEKLLNFPVYAREYFDQGTRRKVEELLQENGLPDEEVRRMVDFAVRVNGDYFAGALGTGTDVYTASPEFALWERQGEELFFASYLSSMFDGERRDHCRLNMRLWE